FCHAKNGFSVHLPSQFCTQNALINFITRFSGLPLAKDSSPWLILSYPWQSALRIFDGEGLPLSTESGRCAGRFDGAHLGIQNADAPRPPCACALFPSLFRLVVLLHGVHAVGPFPVSLRAPSIRPRSLARDQAHRYRLDPSGGGIVRFYGQ